MLSIIRCQDDAVPIKVPCKGPLTAAVDGHPLGVVEKAAGEYELSGWPIDRTGVFDVQVNTDCGCYTFKVNLSCPPPRLGGTYFPTRTPDLQIECCPEENSDTNNGIRL